MITTTSLAIFQPTPGANPPLLGLPMTLFKIISRLTAGVQPFEATSKQRACAAAANSDLGAHVEVDRNSPRGGNAAFSSITRLGTWESMGCPRILLLRATFPPWRSFTQAARLPSFVGRSVSGPQSRSRPSLSYPIFEASSTVLYLYFCSLSSPGSTKCFCPRNRRRYLPDILSSIVVV